MAYSIWPWPTRVPTRYPYCWATIPRQQTAHCRARATAPSRPRSQHSDRNGKPTGVAGGRGLQWRRQARFVRGQRGFRHGFHTVGQRRRHFYESVRSHRSCRPPRRWRLRISMATANSIWSLSTIPTPSRYSSATATARSRHSRLLQSVAVPTRWPPATSIATAIPTWRWPIATTTPYRCC